MEANTRFTVLNYCGEEVGFSFEVLEEIGLNLNLILGE